MNNGNCSEQELAQYLSYDKHFIVRSVATHPVVAEGQSNKKVVGYRGIRHLVGRKVPYHMLEDHELNIKDTSDLRVAIVCNWNDKCGISTYTGYLAKSMRSKIKEMRIFSEHSDDQIKEDDSYVERCWERGESLLPLAEKILEWKPDLVIIQHEYGIFPNAFRFMQLMEALDDVPYLVAMHSVYEHLDKLVYTEACKNIVVHSNDAKETLERLGNTREIDVIHHGCVHFDETGELWNIMRSPYTIMQFGFGFNYKGVDRAIRAIAHLKKNNPEKFENIFYFYLCSTNTHNMVVHNEYYDSLVKLAEEEGVRDNIAIVRKYQSERMLSLYLRLAKIVVFPYVVNGDNKVYGASGATRIAMAHGKPVVCSDSHLFDDLEGIIPRPASHLELAEEIDRIFSDDDHRNEIINSAMNYVRDNSWDHAADEYLSIYPKIMQQRVRNE